jgi:hypothetical protein
MASSGPLGTVSNVDTAFITKTIIKAVLKTWHLDLRLKKFDYKGMPSSKPWLRKGKPRRN